MLCNISLWWKYPQWKHSTWQLPLGDGHAWNWLSHYDDNATISHNDKNRDISSPPESYSFKSRDIEKVTSNGRRHAKGMGDWKGRAFLFPRLSRLRVSLPLVMERLLPVHNISWSYAFAIQWANLCSEFRGKIWAINQATHTIVDFTLELQV